MKQSRWAFPLLALALIVGIVAIYAQSWDFGLLSYDDEGYTVNCPFVKDGFSWSNFVASVKDLAWGGIWMPLTNLTYMVTISLFGSAPGAQHLVSVGFHALNAVLFFRLLSRFTPSLLLPFLAAALWAWHPQRVESVAWIASRKDTVFTLFTLLGLLAWHARHRTWGILAMAAACMSKPTAMCFPFLALAIDFLTPPPPYREPSPPYREPSRPRRFLASHLASHPASLLASFLPYLPLFLLAAATGALAMYSQTHATGEATHELFYSTFGWRVLNAAVSLGRYFYHFVIPSGLHFWYRPVRGGIPVDCALGLVSLAVVALGYLLALWKLPSRRRVLILTALWFLAAIGPTLGVAGSFGNHAMADRFTYVPMMAVSLLAVLTVPRLPRWTLLVPLAYVVPAFLYAATYRDNYTSFVQVAKADPGHAYAWSNIGSETILRTGDLEKGIAYLRKSIAIFPTDEAQGELLMALVSRNAAKDEAEIVENCMRLADWKTSPREGVIPLIPAERDPYGLCMEALGMISTRHQDWPNAVRCFETALARDPREDLRMRLALAYWNQKDRAAARPHLEILQRSPRPDISAKAKELLAQQF